MRKNVFYWIIFIVLCIWQLPQFLVALIMLPFLGKVKKVADRHYNFCFKGEEMRGGISLGPFCFVSESNSKKATVIAHELDGHTVQSKILGPLYLFVIGIPSILHAMFYDRHKSCYYSFYTESWANKCAKLKVNNKCALEFK